MVQSTTPISGIPAIPEVTTDDAEMNLLLSALKESIEVLTGTRGNPNSRALTFGEATNDGATGLFATNQIVQLAQSSQDSVRLTGDVVGTGLFDSGGAVVVPALLQLPNIIRIDGGASDTIYASQIAGPYGIEGTPAGGTTGQVFGKLSDTDYDYGWITQVGFGAGGGVSILQIDTGVNRSEFGTAGTAIPFDNTTPQITEGDQIMSNTFVPQAPGNTLTIEVCAFVTCTTLSDWVTVSLFKDSDPDAIASASVFVDTALGGEMIQFVHYEQSVGVTPIQYTVRAGQDAGTALGFNAIISGGTQPRLNNNFASRLTVTETDLAPSTGLGTDTAVQKDGLTLTAAATLLNFVGFSTQELLPDQITITQGNLITESLFCPNYDYTFVNTTTWQVDGLDVTNLFRQGRRLQFSRGISLVYGSVFSRTFTGGNTVITMAMESGDVLTADATEVCFTISATAWSPIVEDPFSGTAVRSIATGVISSVQYWVIVGDSGKLAYSTDAGVTWTTVVTGTSEHLVSVTYAADVEEFLAGGDAGVLLDSSDGTTWNLDTTSLPALATTGTADVKGIGRSTNEGEWYLIYDGISTNWQTVRDQGTLTWILPPTTIGGLVGTYDIYNDGGNSSLYLAHGDDEIGVLANTADTTTSNLINSALGGVEVATAYSYFAQGVADRHIIAGENGEIANYSSGGFQSRDDTTFTDAHRSITWSDTLERYVIVGDLAQIGYRNNANDLSQLDDNAWTSITSGLAPTANFTDVEWSEADLVFVAVADNGQILRSSNGLGDALLNPAYTGFALEGADPFAGGPINRIMSGVIDSTIWWVAIGNSGQLYTSTNGGITWTSRTTGSAVNLLSIAYDPNNETFGVGGVNGEFLHSDDGITWTRDTTSIPALSGTGSKSVLQMTFDVATSIYWIMYQLTTTVACATISTDFTTFTSTDPSETSLAEDLTATWANTDANRIVIGDGEDTRFFLTATDTSASAYTARAVGQIVSAARIKAGTGGNANNTLLGMTDGTIEQWSATSFISDSDAVVGAQVNMFDYSSNSDRWVAVGNSGKISTMLDAEFNDNPNKIWVPVESDFVGNITDVHYNATDNIFIAVSSLGEIGRSTNGNDDAPGQGAFGGWTLATSPFAPVNAIETGIIDGTNYWVAVGNSGQISTSDDEGATWVAQTSGSATNLVSVAYNSDDEQFAIGGVGEVLWNTLADITTWNIATSAGLVASVGQIEWFASSSVWQLFENNFSDAMWTMSIAGALAEIDVSNALGQFIEYNVHGSQTGMYGVDGTVSIERYSTAISSSPTSTFNHGNAIAGMAFIERPGGLTSYVAAYSGSDTVITANVGTVQATHNNFSGGLGIAVEYSSSNDNFCIVTSFGEIGIINQTDWVVNNSLRVVNHVFDGSAFTDVKWDPNATKYVAVNASGQVGSSTNGVS